MAVPKSDEPICYELRDDIARITLNRPAAANALAPEQRDSLIELFGRCDADPDVRAVLLTSTGKHFCTGADLGRIHRSRGEDKRVGDGMARLLSGALRLISSILDCRKPVVAAVQGVAGGLGLHVALASDLIVAADSASFFEPLILRGLVLDGAGAYLLPRRIGMQRAKEMALLGDWVPAAEALRLGLVNRVVETDRLDEEATALARRVAGAPTSAVSLTKVLLNQSLDAGREQAFMLEALAVEMQSRAEIWARSTTS
jgi:Enoyl-CoA hydratase/carnithine racemase